jgi:uncharacterized protein YjbI with pentapeptide repeats
MDYMKNTSENAVVLLYNFIKLGFLRQSDFRMTEFKNTSFKNCTIEGNDFSKAHISGSNIDLQAHKKNTF